MDVADAVGTALLNGQLTDEESASILDDAGLSSLADDAALPWTLPGGAEATPEDIAGLSYWNEPLSRRSLEAVLAGYAGEDEEAYKLANAHRPWAELYLELQDMPPQAEGIARTIERHHQGWVARHGGPPLSLAPVIDDEMKSWFARLGPGARSGRLDDYSRGELCKLLGYLQRDAKDFSDDDLRAMCLDAHLVPHFKYAPSHAELARREAERYGGSRYRRKHFLKAMRTPYGKLGGSWSDRYRDDGSLDKQTLRELLSYHHPFLCRGDHPLDDDLVQQLCARRGIATRRGEEARYLPAPGAQTKAISSLDHRFGEAFRNFGNRFNGLRLTTVTGHGSTGTWRQVSRGLGNNCWGFYRPSTGEIHLNPKVDRLVSKAQAGKAEPTEVYEAAHTLTHEVLHAASGGDGKVGQSCSNPLLHTMEEGSTESLARLHVDEMARDMKLWKREESLRDYRSTATAYNQETETMVALATAASGELNERELRAGGYAQPEALSSTARGFLTRLHTETPLDTRQEVLAQKLAARHGLSSEQADTLVSKVLTECKKPKYTWRRARRPSRDTLGGAGAYPRYQQPESLSDGLAELMKEVMTHERA